MAQFFEVFFCIFVNRQRPVTFSNAALALAFLLIKTNFQYNMPVRLGLEAWTGAEQPAPFASLFAVNFCQLQFFNIIFILFFSVGIGVSFVRFPMSRRDTFSFSLLL